MRKVPKTPSNSPISAGSCVSMPETLKVFHSQTGSKTVQTDICIVGGGLAGITLAKEFLGMPLRVGVLESGGLEPAAATEALNDVILAGERRLSLDFSRARFLGGTTNLWSGHHSPLNVTQLAPRDWI